MLLKTKFGTFVLVNEDKVQRVLEGTTAADGSMIEGLGADAAEERPEEVLVQYDKLGGLIRGKDNAKVKNGSFYDVKKRTAKAKPEIVYIFRVNRRTVELADGEPLPLEVQAAMVADQENQDEAVGKKPRKAKK